MATANHNLSDYDKDSMPKADHLRFGIVVSEWNPEITEGLYNGAIEVFNEMKVPAPQITRIDVPGSFELPYACSQLVNTKEFDAVIAIGVVIQGETKHFDFVCHGVTQGISNLNTSQDIPVIFCVLTDNNIEQSRARSGGALGNKGTEAAVTAIKMAHLREQFQ